LQYFGVDAAYEHDGAGNFDFYTKGPYTRAVIFAHHTWSGLSSLSSDTPLRSNYSQQYIVSNSISGIQNTRLTSSNTTWIWGVNTGHDFVVGTNFYSEGNVTAYANGTGAAQSPGTYAVDEINIANSLSIGGVSVSRIEAQEWRPADATESGNNYPVGLSYAEVGGLSGFPGTYQTLLTVKHGNFRIGQILFDRMGDNMWFRGWRSDEGWSSFKQVATV
jgi:hypothetical protein